jgi:hypothetical protein
VLATGLVGEALFKSDAETGKVEIGEKHFTDYPN